VPSLYIFGLILRMHWDYQRELAELKTRKSHQFYCYYCILQCRV